jgi:leucine dehydrogenase
MQEAVHEGTLFQMKQMGHEQVVFCYDQPSGLKAVIAVHNTVLGPSLGGTRMWPYTSEAEALRDVLRLSRGMTYKSALAGLHLGGGKAVILGDPRQDKTEALMRRFGQFVDSLGGKYITAEDVGITTRDIEYVAEETQHVAGLPESRGGGGDPSPVTAYGVYMGIKASAKYAYGSDALEGKRILVQGAGHVGSYLVEHLVKEGADVVVSDIHDDKVAALVSRYGVAAIAPDEVYDHPMDIYAPCALGATINDHTMNRLQCDIIAGGANNQLDDETRHGQMLIDKGVVYAPDFLINAGGIINCYSEIVGYNREEAYRRTERIYDVALNVLKTAAEKRKPAQAVAIDMALARIASIEAINTRR